MDIPRRVAIVEIFKICNYFAKKPMGATTEEARATLDARTASPWNLAAMKSWGLLEEQEGRMRATEDCRAIARSAGTEQSLVLARLIRRIPPYAAMVERAIYRGETSVAAVDVATHWHDHFSDVVSGNEEALQEQVVTFFQLAENAGLGKYVVGRKGSPTRFEFDRTALDRVMSDEASSSDKQTNDTPPPNGKARAGESKPATEPDQVHGQPEHSGTVPLGQGIFIAHGKNKKPLDKLKNILDQFKVPYKIAVEEPNLGRPIGTKVRDIMNACNCAILIFTADEEFRDADGNTVWRPSENVVFELGAAGYLYQDRIVIMKESTVVFPSNFRDLGYISFEAEKLEATAMEILKELIGFGIVKIST